MNVLQNKTSVYQLGHCLRLYQDARSKKKKRKPDIMFYKTHIRPLHMAKFRPLSEEGGKMLTNH